MISGWHFLEMHGLMSSAWLCIVFQIIHCLWVLYTINCYNKSDIDQIDTRAEDFGFIYKSANTLRSLILRGDGMWPEIEYGTFFFFFIFLYLLFWISEIQMMKFGLKIDTTSQLTTWLLLPHSKSWIWAVPTLTWRTGWQLLNLVILPSWHCHHGLEWTLHWMLHAMIVSNKV